MNWEQKTELCKLLNTGEYEKALDLVIDNIDNMDDQSWEMFFMGIDLIESLMQPLFDKHKKIYDATRGLQSGSYKTALRMALYDEIIEKITDKQSKQNIMNFKFPLHNSMPASEIKECNQLIADFQKEMILDGNILYVFAEIPPEKYRFHDSWEWIMSVVEKIAELKYPVALYFSHIQNSSSIHALNQNNDVVRVSLTRESIAAIEVVYRAVVEFIKGYNSDNSTEPPTTTTMTTTTKL